jgi:hypothetical protein
MNPEVLSDSFLGSVVPRSVPVTARFWRCRRRAANMPIKYMFIVQRYGLMPAGFCTRGWTLTGIVGLGDPEKAGASKPADDQIAEDAAPGN